MENIEIIAADGGTRIDAWLSANVPDLTRNAAQRLLTEGMVLVNGKPPKKNYKISAGDAVIVTIPDIAEVPLVPQNIPLDIVFEDEDVVVVNKPRGMVVHPAPGHPDGTLVNALMYHCGDSLSGVGGEKRPGIVHRIDKDTSGLLIVAKNDAAHLALSAQLSDRSLSRVYRAVVVGNLKQDSGTVDAPIGRHPNDRKKMAVTHQNSRNAVTHWSVLERYRGYTHVRCKLETGRTHQIRLHLSHISHPIAGDFLYGTELDELPQRFALHSAYIALDHPITGARIEYESPLPPELQRLLQEETHP